jgi:hypothetical protein
MQASIGWDAAEAVARFAVFDLSAFKEQVPIIIAKHHNKSVQR